MSFRTSTNSTERSSGDINCPQVVTSLKKNKIYWSPAIPMLRSNDGIFIDTALRLSHLIGLRHQRNRLPEALNHLRIAFGLNSTNAKVLCCLTDLGFIQGIL